MKAIRLTAVAVCALCVAGLPARADATTYDKIISVSIRGGTGYPGLDTTPNVADGAGVVPADNWNNLVYNSAEATYDHTQFVDNSGAAAVSMSLRQKGGHCVDADVTGDPGDPNLDLYRSQAPTSVRGWSGELGGGNPHTQLTGLQTEFPNGYDVIINTARWSPGESGGESQYIVVDHTPESFDRSAFATNFWAGSVANLELHMTPLAYDAVMGFVEGPASGSNYVKVSNLKWDTLDFQPLAGLVEVFAGWNCIQITGLQILGLAPGELEPLEFIVDNLDPEWNWSGPVAASDAVDAWRTLSYWGREGTACTWNTPALPFSEATEYEVFTWIASEKTSAPGTYYDRDSNAIYTIKHAFGETEFVFDQNLARGQGWYSLGTWSFTGDGTEYVSITSGAQAGQPVTSYDAVRWLWTPPPQVQAIPEPTGLGLVGLALLAVRRRRS